MFTSYIEECKPNMFQLQCMKELEKQLEQGKEYNEAAIARTLSVNRSTVFRCLKRCVQIGILTEKSHEFTRKGKEILEYYKGIEKDLLHYFEKIGVEEEERQQAVAGMLDGIDIKTIQTICQKEKMHIQYENIGMSAEERECVLEVKLENLLKPGVYEVDYSIYRQGKDRSHLSMADMGFLKPGILHYEEEEGYLELTANEVQAYSKIEKKRLMKGIVETMKLRCVDDNLRQLEIKDGKVRIPLSEFWIESPAEGELTGQVQLTMTCTVGVTHMPEGVATLIMRL